VLFISHTGDALLGGVALFVMSIGMGMPLLLVFWFVRGMM
jgi:thiol:disulfide interchange protein DsbD